MKSTASFSPASPNGLLLGAAFLLALVAASSADLRISEFMAAADPEVRNADGAPSDWIEVTNLGDESASLEGCFLTDDPSDLRKWQFPPVALEAGASQLVLAAGETLNPPSPGVLQADFTLAREGEYLALVAADGASILSEFAPRYPAQLEGVSYGIGSSGAIARETLVTRDHEVRYLIPRNGDLAGSWNQSPAQFDDSGWTPGVAGVGFETSGGTLQGLITTNILGDMRAVNSSGYFRFPFEFDGQDREVISMQLKVRIDDGFVAYLNGVEMGKFLSPAQVSWNAAATGSRSDLESIEEPIVLDVSAFRAAVRDGANVLAIQGLNSNVNNSDFLLEAELLAEVQDVSAGLQEGWFAEPTPGEPNDFVKNQHPGEVIFSRGDALFTENFFVELTNPTPGAVIRYTTDLSVPRNDFENPSPAYTGPIEITESTQIRARAFLAGALDGPVQTVTFLKMDGEVPAFSSDLPVIVLSTLGTGPPPGTQSTIRKPAYLFFFEPDPETGRTVLTQGPALTARAGVRRRGSSSGGWPKWSLSVETWNDGDDEDRNLEPFGMPVEADWILNARYEWDLALMRNPFVYEISRQIGRYAPRTKFVEVFSDTSGTAMDDNDYFGVYSLIEKIERDGDRVDIARIDPWQNHESEISGGYIFKNDRPDPGEPTINVRGMGQITLVDPDGGEISAPQRNWLTAHLNELDVALRNEPEGINPATGLHLSEYLDVASWIDHHLLNLLVMNIDWGRHSAFFHKDRGGRIVSGPVWDYDRSLGCEDVRDNNPLAWEGVVNAVGTVSSKTWYDSRYPWYGNLLGPNENPAEAHYPEIRQQHTDRWFELRKGPFSIENLHAVIDGMAAEIRESQARNFTRWTQHPPNGGNFADPGLTGWEAEISHMKNWLVARTEWLDAQYLQPPAFNTPGGIVLPGFSLLLTSPDGRVYYTADGSDPRAPGGLPSAQAQAFPGGPIDETLVDLDASGRYLVPSDDSLGLNWTRAPDEFDDSGWSPAVNGIGFERSGGILGLISTNIEREMRTVNASCYLRLPFDFENSENLNSMTLTVWADDGFVAYLNGTEVGSFLKPTPLTWNSRTDGGQSFPGGDEAVVDEPVVLDLSAFTDQIRDGSNVLALHGLNNSAGSFDFVIRALLSVNHTVTPAPVTLAGSRVITARTYDGAEWSAPETRALISPDDLADRSNFVISEIMYRPPLPDAREIEAGWTDREAFEFLEFMNISDRPVALAGMALRDGVAFDFNRSRINLVEPGERVLLVQNEAAFRFRYGPALSDRIMGEFENDTRLRNEGERLVLAALDGEELRSLTYDNDLPWPVAPGEVGFSLVLVDPASNPDHALASSWQLSPTSRGTPGAGDELTFMSWAGRFGNPSPDSDADSDGRTALMEYAMGTDPRRADSAGPASGLLQVGNTATFSFRRNSTARDVTFALESSTDLETWLPADPIMTLVAETPHADGTTTMTYQSVAAEIVPGLFLRMRVALP